MKMLHRFALAIVCLFCVSWNTKVEYNQVSLLYSKRCVYGQVQWCEWFEWRNAFSLWLWRVCSSCCFQNNNNNNDDKKTNIFVSFDIMYATITTTNSYIWGKKAAVTLRLVSLQIKRNEMWNIKKTEKKRERKKHTVSSCMCINITYIQKLKNRRQCDNTVKAQTQRIRNGKSEYVRGAVSKFVCWRRICVRECNCEHVSVWM